MSLQRPHNQLLLPQVSALHWCTAVALALVGVLAQYAGAEAESRLVPGWDVQVEGWSVVELQQDGAFGGPFGIITDNGIIKDRASAVGRECVMYEGFTWWYDFNDREGTLGGALSRFDSMILRLSLDMMLSFGMLEPDGQLGYLGSTTFRSTDQRLFGIVHSIVQDGTWHYRFVWCYAE